MISLPIKLSLFIYSLLKLKVLNTLTKKHCIGGVDHGVRSKVLNQEEGENMMVVMGFIFSRCLLHITTLVIAFLKWSRNAHWLLWMMKPPCPSSYNAKKKGMMRR